MTVAGGVSIVPPVHHDTWWCLDVFASETAAVIAELETGDATIQRRGLSDQAGRTHVCSQARHRYFCTPSISPNGSTSREPHDGHRFGGAASSLRRPPRGWIRRSRSCRRSGFDRGQGSSIGAVCSSTDDAVHAMKKTQKKPVFL
jgi:hypothetical protein